MRAVAAFVLALLLPVAALAQGLTVFAAASLKPALDGMIAAGCCAEVAVSYGGSGLLARQIARGAPGDVLILADPDWLSRLGGRGLGAPVTIAGNRMILASRVPGDLPLTPGALAAHLSGVGLDGVGRIAMGDPRFVPAGRYGALALAAAGLEPPAVYTDNVRGALAFLARGEVALALVYASDIVGETGVFEVAALPLPPQAEPIRYVAVALNARPETADFIAALIAPEGQAALARAGFAPPPPSAVPPQSAVPQ